MRPLDFDSDSDFSDFDQGPARKYPDERERDPIQLGFHEFCMKADELYVSLQENTATDEEEALAAKEFYRFVLAGRTHGPDHEPAHITLNVHSGLQDNRGYQVSRDYDSLIGISHDLPYSRHVQLTPVPPFRHTLKKNNHMKAMAFLDVIILSLL